MLDVLINLVNPDGIARVFKGRSNTVILLYHAPKADVFEKHVQYLSAHYTFIALGDYIQAVENNSWDKIPKNSMVITFDDGHASNFELMHLFIQYKIRPTIYLCSGIVGTNKKYWWHGLSLTKVEELKRLPNKERVAFLDDHVIVNNGEPDALSNDQISEMSPYVDFQSHTKSHPILTMLDDTELYEELHSPIEDLKKYGLQIRHFAYPNGDYSEREIKLLSNLGYVSARTVDIGWNGLKADLFRLKIMGISDNASVAKLKLQISGIHGWLMHILKSQNIFGLKKAIK